MTDEPHRPRRGTQPAEENPNQWLLDLADALANDDWKPGPPVDSQEARDRRGRDLYRDTFNREPEAWLVREEDSK